MSIKKRYISLAIASLLSSQSYAAGFQVSEHSASGLGRAFAGEAAIADDASVIGRNPAAMTHFKQAEFSGALSVINPSIDIYDHTWDQGAEDVAPIAFVPAGYYVHPVNDQLAVGLAMFSNYGVTTDYPTDFNAGSLAGKTSLLTVNLNPSVAYKLTPQLSIGGGVSLVYGKAELNRHLGSLSIAVPGSNPSDKTISMEGDTWAWGWNIGAFYELNENNRFGLSYRSQVDLDFDGDFTDYLGVITGKPNNTITGSLSVPLPAIAEFSGFHQLNKQWALHYSLQWTQYSKFKELRATSSECKPGYNGQSGICLLKKEDYDDTYRWAIGTTYTLNPLWTLRAGFAFDEQAGKPTLSIPDTDRYWYSAGATYHYNQHLSFDAGFSFIYSSKATFTEDNSTFTSKGKAYLAAVQANYKF
ncbi:TPA: outer membrane protein transport protein [Photobacterium damselae]